MVSTPFLIKAARKALVLTTLLLLMGMMGETVHETVHETASFPDVPEATWAVEPTTPGEDLPQSGHSLFDRLFTVDRNGQGVHALPFPFTELIKTIEARLTKKKSGRVRVKQVLIPLGRSLQRHAAAPDYFKHPRVVVAVDSEPDNPGDLLLKDRLFLGYQKKANLIEVISYNEQDGRFEFQVVRDYGPSSKPKVLCAANDLPELSPERWPYFLQSSVERDGRQSQNRKSFIG